MTARRQTDDIVPNHSPSHNPTPADGFQLRADAIASAIGQVSSPDSPVSPLQVNRDLAEAADSALVLLTKQLARVLGQSNSSLQSWDRITHRHGFDRSRDGVGKFRARRAS